MATLAAQKTVVHQANEVGENVVEEAAPETPQDTNITVQIDVPGTKSFELQVSTGELVNDLRGYITDREDCCHRTCFSLQFNGIPMDHFAELRSVEGLKDHSVFKVVEEPYTTREARLHIRHVRDLIKSLDTSDAMNGLNGASISYLNTITEGEIDPNTENDLKEPTYIQSNAEPQFAPLFPSKNDQHSCLNVLAMSLWNPPPGNRRLNGDLLYLYTVTSEGKSFHLTASPKGFYVNNCSFEKFDPSPADVPYLSHSLVDLMSQLSPGFRKGWVVINKKRCSLHPFERLPTNYQLFSWLSPKEEHQVDCVRAEDAYTARSTEEHIPGQTREWNEELQAVRELPCTNLHERLLRDRAFFKVHSDFVAAATRGAMLVVDGGVLAINPGDEPRSQMFIWSNIFFSLGFDVRDHYGEYGGDAAAFAAPLLDLRGVQLYNSADIKGLHTLGTVIIDYKGFRITAQSIIPGILEREQEQSVVYGSIDFGKTIVTSPDYDGLLDKVAKATKQQVHLAKNKDGEIRKLYTSVETKGIQGNDKRNYVLDLLRTMPPDVNFLNDLSADDLVMFSNEARGMQFPRAHTHKLAVHRTELVDAFCESRYLAYWRMAMKTTSETKKEIDAITDLSDDEKKKMLEEKNKELIKKAATEVGSISSEELDIRFNSDIFSKTVSHVIDENEQKRQKQLIVDVAEFLLAEQIPQFVKECKEGIDVCLDTVSLIENLHSKGIGVRYLGLIQKLLSKEEDNNLEHVINTVNTEMISRAIKWIFRYHLQKTDQGVTAIAVSHLLNCLFSSCSVPTPTSEDINSNHDSGSSKKKKNKKGKKGQKSAPAEVNPAAIGWQRMTNEWRDVTPDSIWKEVEKRARSYFKTDINANTIDNVCLNYKIQKASLLRDVCLKNGIQLHLRDYDLTNKNKIPFKEGDIMSMFPIVKHLNPRASDGAALYTKGQQLVSQGYLKDGYNMINEGLQLFTSVYGNIHVDVINSYRLLAKLDYMQGSHTEAIEKQHKACLLAERCLGMDNPSTIQEYVTLSHYCFATVQVPASLKLLYRARYLLKLINGEDHPEMATIDQNIGLVLFFSGHWEQSENFFRNALLLFDKFQAKKPMKAAICNHQIARCCSFKSDFKGAIASEKLTYAAYRELFGDDHERTKESNEFLKFLTQQAVAMAKTMTAMQNKTNVKGNLPLPMQPPQHQHVLETMNVANGVYFAVSADQRDRIRKRQRVEMEKQMKEIAEQAGASKDQFDEAMKLAKTVLEKKDESNGEGSVAAVAASASVNQDGDQTQIEEELD